jgi:DNA-binding NarL/FixJ family response regulator
MTPFQKRLCRLRASELSNKEIAGICGLAEKTIRNAFWAIRKELAIPDKDMSLIRNASEVPSNQRLTP